MSKAGRPKLLQKDGHHRHDGYGRWHPMDQVHRPDLHQDLLLKIDAVEDVASLDTMSKGPASEIYSLILSLEKVEYGKALLFELQNTIQTLMQNRKLQDEVRPRREERNEQSALGDANDTEDREPNTYGLP